MIRIATFLRSVSSFWKFSKTCMIRASLILDFIAHVDLARPARLSDSSKPGGYGSGCGGCDRPCAAPAGASGDLGYTTGQLFRRSRSLRHAERESVEPERTTARSPGRCFGLNQVFTWNIERLSRDFIKTWQGLAVAGLLFAAQ